MTRIGFKLGTMLKAIYAGAGAALTGTGTALVEAHTFTNVSDGSWVTIAALTLGSIGAVYGVTNTNAAPDTGVIVTGVSGPTGTPGK